MNLPFGVLAVYAALVIWLGLLIVGWRRNRFGAFLGFGLGLLLFLNLRYFVAGIPDSIAFFIGIYDVPDNLGLAEGQGAAALSACPNNDCTVWGEHYTQHPAWGAAFYDRFLNGSQLRSALLYGHILFNTITFVLMHVQLFRPGTGSRRSVHRVLGRVSFLSLTLGVGCAVWLAAEHGPVGEYGGNLSMVGFWFMSACVYVCAVMGVVAIRRGDVSAHRIWMIRFAGSMWGSFWLFRVMLFVIGPIFRNIEAAAILACIWLSAPLGILIAEGFRRRMAAQRPPSVLPAASVSK
ncbi:MAG: DUF2306 domain-containing protein [Myxococcota bacterium]